MKLLFKLVANTFELWLTIEPIRNSVFNSIFQKKKYLTEIYIRSWLKNMEDIHFTQMEVHSMMKHVM